MKVATWRIDYREARAKAERLGELLLQWCGGRSHGGFDQSGVDCFPGDRLQNSMICIQVISWGLHSGMTLVGE